MGMTLTEKILANHAGVTQTRAGDMVWVEADVLMTHDVCGPPTFDIFRKQFGAHARVWDSQKLVIFPDHYIFSKDPHAQRNIDILRRFAAEQKLPHYHDVGTPDYIGICHCALAEQGWTLPGTVIFGTDSHSCTAGAFGAFATGIGNTDAAFILGMGKLWVKVPPTIRFEIDGEIPDWIMAKDMILHIIGEIGVEGASYCAMEFAGTAVESLSIDERMTLCNMGIEAGAKNAIIKADSVTEKYLKSCTQRPYTILDNDHDACFKKVIRYDTKTFYPLVAKPHSPDNTARAQDMSAVVLNKAYIGSCTGGKLSDFIAAARILNDHRVSVETYIVPATEKIRSQLKQETVNGKSVWDIFEHAGARIGSPSCAACLGGPEDTFGRLMGKEICISTTNRNFPGRMGSKDSQVYLASPYTVAASAIRGVITDPREFLR